MIALRTPEVARGKGTMIGPPILKVRAGVAERYFAGSLEAVLVGRSFTAMRAMGDKFVSHAAQPSDTMKTLNMAMTKPTTRLSVDMTFPF